MQEFNITKASGQKEPFSLEKFKASIKRSGLTEEQASNVLNTIKSQFYPGISTQKIYKLAFSQIKKINKKSASKYSLKNSIRALGPTGFPFEKLVSQILKYQAYEVKTGQLLQGICITHEIDVVALKEGKTVLVEAKFHNEPGYKTNVKVPLYIKARFDDIWATKKYKIDYSLIVTNTKFTSDAIAYAECVNLLLMAWGYPKHNGIDHLINKYKLFPITSLHSINKMQKQLLLNAGIITCHELVSQIDQLKLMIFDDKTIQSIKNECHALSL